MRSLLLSLALCVLAGCTVSDMASTSREHLADAGLLDHGRLERTSPWRLQADSFIYIAQGHFAPRGSAVRPNVVAEESFTAFVEYFPLVRRAEGPLGLEQALAQARAAGAHYLLYGRFASADDRVGTYDEWADEQDAARLGTDKGVIQMMLFETSTRYLVDSVTVRSRGGLLTVYDKKPEDLFGPSMREYARRLLGIPD